MPLDPADHHGHCLTRGATAIMLRRVPSKLTAEAFLDILNQFCPCGYDFVYVPRDKVKARNVALAFVNFTDHTTAEAAYAYFQGHAQPMDARLGSHIRVSQADVQGLGRNLAYFIARNGMVDLDHPHAPQVFQNGRRINLLEAAQMHVSMELLGQATEYMRAVEADRRRVPPASVYAVPETRTASSGMRDDSSGSSPRCWLASDETDLGDWSSSRESMGGDQHSLCGHLHQPPDDVNAEASGSNQVLCKQRPDGSMIFFL